jgi:sec-independent protein translocase protein TatA
MGSMSAWHWIIVLAVGLLLFGGRGKISELMGDFAKGIKSFKKGLSEEEKPEVEPPATTEPPKNIDHQQAGGAAGATMASGAAADRKAG